mmetsp:Transcript_16303/g.27448  ORF Transcript_16303/g.27448 Transcript_16303/m.27448 type:complete len:101 (-) Transcript_16303:81-383(-)
MREVQVIHDLHSSFLSVAFLRWQQQRRLGEKKKSHLHYDDQFGPNPCSAGQQPPIEKKTNEESKVEEEGQNHHPDYIIIAEDRCGGSMSSWIMSSSCKKK